MAFTTLNLVIHRCSESELEDLIAAHRYLFFEINLPVLSDAEYDRGLATARAALPITSPAKSNALGIESYTERQILLALHLLSIWHCG